MKEKKNRYDVLPFLKVRQPIINVLRQAKRMNIIYGFLEVDVTNARNLIR